MFITEGVMSGDRLPLGTRVTKGPDWTWGNQGGGGPGTVVQHENKKREAVSFFYPVTIFSANILFNRASSQFKGVYTNVKEKKMDKSLHLCKLCECISLM